MEADLTDPLEKRHTQTRYLKRFVLRRLAKKEDAESDRSTCHKEIAFRFMEAPTLENVHHLCLFYGYGKVRSALVRLENALFEDFFYGKIFLYPLWLKRFSKIFDAARPRPQIRELFSSQE